MNLYPLPRYIPIFYYTFDPRHDQRPNKHRSPVFLPGISLRPTLLQQIPSVEYRLLRHVVPISENWISKNISSGRDL